MLDHCRRAHHGISTYIYTYIYRMVAPVACTLYTDKFVLSGDNDGPLYNNNNNNMCSGRLRVYAMSWRVCCCSGRKLYPVSINRSNSRPMTRRWWIVRIQFLNIYILLQYAICSVYARLCVDRGKNFGLQILSLQYTTLLHYIIYRYICLLYTSWCCMEVQCANLYDTRIYMYVCVYI